MNAHTLRHSFVSDKHQAQSCEHQWERCQRTWTTWQWTLNSRRRTEWLSVLASSFAYHTHHLISRVVFGNDNPLPFLLSTATFALSLIIGKCQWLFIAQRIVIYQHLSLPVCFYHFRVPGKRPLPVTSLYLFFCRRRGTKGTDFACTTFPRVLTCSSTFFVYWIEWKSFALCRLNGHQVEETLRLENLLMKLADLKIVKHTASTWYFSAKERYQWNRRYSAPYIVFCPKWTCDLWV